MEESQTSKTHAAMQLLLWNSPHFCLQSDGRAVCGSEERKRRLLHISDFSWLFTEHCCDPVCMSA